MGEPEVCGQMYRVPDGGGLHRLCERPAGHEPPAPEGCGPATCQVLNGHPVSRTEWRCGNPLPCDEHPVHGPENAAPERPESFVVLDGERFPLDEGLAEVWRRTAPERPPADDDARGCICDPVCFNPGCPVHDATAQDAFLAAGWRPPEASTVDRDPHGDCHTEACHSTQCPCWQDGYEAEVGSAVERTISERLDRDTLARTVQRILDPTDDGDPTRYVAVSLQVAGAVLGLLEGHRP